MLEQDRYEIGSKITNEFMIEAGTKLGRYEIRSKIGEGGMGEVYLARDPKIGRDVAIKVLPASLSRNRERLARFEQEAQAAGSLNHPNILAIYDVQTEDGAPYVVSELLAGETLRDVIGGIALPVRKALGFGLQIAQGLAAAHEKGIIHRDLKPENLFVTVDGRVKILDFGVAKLTETNSNSINTDLPTRKVNTEAGSVVGTVGYMSPEQLRAKPVDQRTDIFSFGTVLYEMLSGRKAFQKDSTADTISAILREDPPEVSETNKNVNSGLERIVHRCLEKNREERFHSASDLAFALEALTAVQSSGETSVVGGYRDKTSRTWLKISYRLGWATAALLLVFNVLAALYFRRTEPRHQTVRFTLTAPENLTFGDSLALSPDGGRLAFVAMAATGEPSLWVRALDSVEAQNLKGTEGAAFPFWSPDGRYVAFFAGGKLKKIESTGGPIQILSDTAAETRGGSWSLDGTIIFSPAISSPLFKVSAIGGQPSQITAFDMERGHTSHRWPWFLPDGRHYLYFGRGGKKDLEGVFVGSLDSREAKFVLNSRVRAIYAPSVSDRSRGFLLYVRDGTLLAQPFDPTKLELSGEAVTIAQNVLSYPTELGPTGNSVISASANGHLVFRVGGQPISQLIWSDRSGKLSDPIVPPGVYREPMISPDGKRIVMSRQLENTEDIWFVETSRDARMTRFTFDRAADVSAVWTPDGSHVIFASNRNGKFELYQKSSGGAGVEELLLSAEGSAYPHGVTPDGKYILYEFGGLQKTHSDIWALPTFGDRKPFPIVQSEFVESHAQFSPDGRWVAFVSDESGRAEVYVQNFPSSGGKWQVSLAGGDQPMWNPRQREIFYMAPDRSIVSVPYKVSGDTFEIGHPTVLFKTHAAQSSLVDDRNGYLIASDGRFLINNLVEEGLSTPLTVVLNWNADVNIKK
jgi:serine/threonine protein kinase/Tol biopolymer transport system component